MTEHAIVRRILRALNALPNAKAIKIHGGPYTESGTPDIHLTYRGWSYWLEVKQPGGTPTPIQWQRLKEWESAGATVAVVTSWEDVAHLLELGS